MGNAQEISFPTFSETIEKILKENIRAAFEKLEFYLSVLNIKNIKNCFKKIKCFSWQ